MRSKLVAAVVLLTTSFTAFAEEAKEAPAPAASEKQERELTADEKWDLAYFKVPPWTQKSGQGIGLSYQLGSWAGNWTQEVRVRFPFFRSMAMNLSGLYVGDYSAAVKHNLGGK